MHVLHVGWAHTKSCMHRSELWTLMLLSWCLCAILLAVEKSSLGTSTSYWAGTFVARAADPFHDVIPCRVAVTCFKSTLGRNDDVYIPKNICSRQVFSGRWQIMLALTKHHIIAKRKMYEHVLFYCLTFKEICIQWQAAVQLQGGPLSTT